MTVAANGEVYADVWYPSLQELSGLCFVGLGLLAHRRPWAVVACWSVAMWFKSPFAWLLLAFGLLLARNRPHRAAGAVAVGLAGATLAVAVWQARGGSYTSSVARPSAGTVAHAVQ